MLDGIIVFLIGAAVGIGELVARYRDEPRRAIFTRPAMLYVGINGFASLFALVAILTFGWTSNASDSPAAKRLVEILTAGFGAMAVFRSSLFTVRVGTNDVGVGPIAFLQILLGATDRGVDRKRASDRAEKVVRIMGDLDPMLAYRALPAFAIMLMQNLTLEDQQAIGSQVQALTLPDLDIPEQAKVLNVGLLLMNFVGEEVLEDAVRGIKGQLKPGVRLPSIALRPRTEGESSGETSGRSGADGLGAGAPGVEENDRERGSGAVTRAAGAAGVEEDVGKNLLDGDQITPKVVAEPGEPQPPAGKSAPGTALPPP